MEKISISEELKSKYNDAALGCLKCSVTVCETPDELLEEIKNVSDDLQSKLTMADIKNRERIAQTRDCYRALGKDPHRYRNSAEAMHRRILQGKGLYKINNVVDSCNLVCVKTGFSLGAYDLSKLSGDIVWAVTPEGMQYEGIGKSLVNVGCLPALKDDEGFFGNPTSDSVRAMITESAKEMILCIYGFGGESGLKEALEEGERLLSKYCGAADIEKWIVK